MPDCQGAEVTAIEKDPILAARLADALGSPADLRVVPGDALEVVARPENFELALGDFDCLVSNLPYQAGTRILLEFVQRRMPPSMTVLVQTEVAERLAAKEGGKTSGLAGVWTQLDYDVRIVRRVSASCFWPRPEVGSTVVRLDRHERSAGMTPEERKTFRRITKLAFEHRRKQLGNVLGDMVQSTARAEELSNEDWVKLAKGITRNENS